MIFFKIFGFVYWGNRSPGYHLPNIWNVFQNCEKRGIKGDDLSPESCLLSSFTVIITELGDQIPKMEDSNIILK